MNAAAALKREGSYRVTNGGISLWQHPWRVRPRSGELRTQKLKSHLLRTQSLKVLTLKPGVGQYIAMHATLTARDFFLVSFYAFCPFTYIFPNLSRVFPVLAVANTGSCVGPQNKIGQPAHRYRQLMQVPCWMSAEYKQAPKQVLLFFLGLCSEIVNTVWGVDLEQTKRKKKEKKKACGVMTCRINNQEILKFVSTMVMQTSYRWTCGGMWTW